MIKAISRSQSTLSCWRIGGSTPWPSWWQTLGQPSRHQRFLDQGDRPSLGGTSRPGWRGEQIWSGELGTTCSSRYQDRFCQAYQCWGGRSWFWREPLVVPWGTRLAKRARNRRYLPRMESQLVQQSWRRNVLGSSRLAQRKFQRLDLERVFEFPFEKIIM